MYALPGQDLEGALRDVREAIALGAPHVSAYHLTLEPDTHFHRFPPALPDEDLAADMQDAIERELAGAGYGHYETSAFAKHGHRARHNLNYWTFGDYIGLGAGAHAKISFRDRITREQRIRKPVSYMRAAIESNAIDAAHEVEEAELPFEFMLNALRLVDGFALDLFTQRTGSPVTMITGELDRAQNEGLVERDHAHVRPTARGRRFLNELMQRFLPTRAARGRTIPIRGTCSPGTSRPS